MSTANKETCQKRLLDESAVRNRDCPVGLHYIQVSPPEPLAFVDEAPPAPALVPQPQVPARPSAPAGALQPGHARMDRAPDPLPQGPWAPDDKGIQWVHSLQELLDLILVVTNDDSNCFM